VAAILDGRGQAVDQPVLPIHTAQQQRTEVARYRAALEVGSDRETGDGRKTQLARDRITRGQSRLGFVRSVIGVTTIISMG